MVNQIELQLASLDKKVKLSIEEVSANLKMSNEHAKCELEIAKLNLMNLSKNAHAKYILTSEFEHSFDSQLKSSAEKSGGHSKSIVVRFDKQSKGPLSMVVCFGELYTTFESTFLSSFLNEIFSLVKPKNSKPFTWPEIKNGLLMDQLDHFAKNKDNKMPSIREKDLQLGLTIKASLLSVSFIAMNEPYYLPLARLEGQASVIDFRQYVKANKIKIQLGTTTLFDLTNFPETLTSLKPERIQPRVIFSNENAKARSELDIVVKDAFFYDVPDRNDVSVTGTIKGFWADYQFTQTKRLIDYILEEVIPILISKELVPDISMSSMDQINLIYQRLMLGFWVKLDLQLEDCEFFLCKGASREEIRLRVSKAHLTNRQVKNLDRVIEMGPSEVGISDMISEEYDIALEGITVVVPERMGLKTLIPPINGHVKVNLILSERDYSLFFYSMPVTNLKTWLGQTQPESVKNQNIAKKSVLKYENSIWVNVDLDSVVLELGNEEYLRIMRTMFESILFDDFRADLFSAHFDLKKKHYIEMGVFIEIGINKLGVIFKDSQDEPFGVIYVQNGSLGVLINDNGPIDVRCNIEDIKGSFLECSQGEYIEKELANQAGLSRRVESVEQFKKNIRNWVGTEGNCTVRKSEPKMVFAKEEKRGKIYAEICETENSRIVDAKIRHNQINLNANFLNKLIEIFLHENEEDLLTNKKKLYFKRDKANFQARINERIGRAGHEVNHNFNEFTISTFVKFSRNTFAVCNGPSDLRLLIQGDIDLKAEVIKRMSERDRARDLAENRDFQNLLESLKHKDLFVKSGRMISNQKFSDKYVAGDFLGVSRFEGTSDKEVLNKLSDEVKLEQMYAILRNRMNSNVQVKVHKLQTFFEEVTSREKQVKPRKLMKPCEVFLEIEIFEYFKEMQEDSLKSNREISSLTVSQMNIKEKIQSFRHLQSKHHIDFTQGEVKLFNEIVLKGNTDKMVVNMSIKDVGKFNQILQFQMENVEAQTRREEPSRGPSVAESGDVMRVTNIEFMVYDSVWINLINDYKGVLKKSFVILFRDLLVIVDSTDVTSVIVKFQMECQYFNSRINHWEPFVENSKFILEMEQSFETQEEQISHILKEKKEKEDQVAHVSKDLETIQEIHNERYMFEKKMEEMNELDESIPAMASGQAVRRKRTICRILQGIDIEEKEKTEEESESGKVMNVNLTLELLKEIKHYMQSTEEVLDESAQKSLPKSLEAPFKIKNVSGYPLEVTLIKEEFLLNRNCKLDRKELLSKHYSVPADSTIDIFDDFDSFFFQKSNKKMHMNFGTSMTFSVIHPEYPKWKSQLLSVANQTFQQVTLINKEGIKNEMLYLSRIKSDSKEIYVGSSVEIANMIPADEFGGSELTIRILKKNQVFTKRAKFGENFFVPFDFVDGVLWLKLEGKRLLKSGMNLAHFKLQNHGHLTYFQNDETGRTYAIRYERDLESFFKLKFTFLPMLEIANFLPFYSEILLSDSSLKQVIALKPGQEFFTNEYSAQGES